MGTHRPGPPLGAAAISVGTNPTFEVRQRRVEAFVLDFDGDLYGDALGIEFLVRLRGMERYDTVDALVEQMHKDVASTRDARPDLSSVCTHRGCYIGQSGRYSDRGGCKPAGDPAGTGRPANTGNI